MRRRKFMALLGGASLWSLATRAQQPDRTRRIGVLMNRSANDPDGQTRLSAFQQSLQQLGWNDGRNVRIDTCWGADDVDRERRCAAELVALTPDVVLASGTLGIAALQQVTHSTQIVFVAVADPVSQGFVDSLSRPGGNITGFMLFEFSFGGKWLQLLKQIAPNVTRAAVFRDPAVISNMPEFAAIQAMAQSLGVEVKHARCRGNRERHHDLCPLSEWRPNFYNERVGVGLSRSDHHARGPAQAACNLPLPLHGDRRRLDVVRA